MNSLIVYDASRTDASIMLSSVLIEEEIKLIHSNYYSVLWLEKGSGILETDFFQTAYQQGDIYCFNNYQAFSIRPDQFTQFQLLRFHPNFFCIETHQHEVGCNGILFNDVYDVAPIHIGETIHQELKNLFQQIDQEQYNPDQTAHELLFSYLKIVLIRLTRAKTTQECIPENMLASGDYLISDQRINPDSLTTGDQITAMMNLINQHFHIEHQPAYYAEALHVSVKTLNKNCKKYFNKTLSALISEKILLKAKWALLHSTDPVKSIAASVGFRDEYYFSRFFKKHVGLSPKFFRDEEWRIRKGYLSIP